MTTPQNEHSSHHRNGNWLIALSAGGKILFRLGPRVYLGRTPFVVVKICSVRATDRVKRLPYRRKSIAGTNHRRTAPQVPFIERAVIFVNRRGSRCVYRPVDNSKSNVAASQRKIPPLRPAIRPRVVQLHCRMGTLFLHHARNSEYVSMNLSECGSRPPGAHGSALLPLVIRRIVCKRF